MGEHATDRPQPPRPQALSVLRSLTGIVDSATTVASTVVADIGALDGVSPELRTHLVGLCDAVFDLDYRTANLTAPPSGAQLKLD